MRTVNHRTMVLAALLLAGAVAACGGDGDRDAFTFTDDELCDWITADEVAGFFASVHEWDGTAELVDTDDADPDECFWRLEATAGGGFIEIGAGNADPGFLLPYDEVVEYDGPGPRVVGVGDQDRFFVFADQLLQELGWVS